MSFQNLSPLASKVLGVLSLLAPDAVPESLFEVRGGSILHVRTNTKQHRVFDAVRELTSHGLVQKDSDTNTLSTHRLIQSEFRYYINERLQDSFLNSSKLLYESFPKQVHDRTFQPRFKECARLIPHVLGLAQQQQLQLLLMSSATPGLQASTAFCRLTCNAAYYQAEIGSTRGELAKTVEAAMQSFHSTGLTHEDPLAYARICNTAALEKEMSGDFRGAKSLLDIALKLRSDNLPPGHEDIWVVMNNLGNLNLSLQNYSEALRFHLLCKETVAKHNATNNYQNLARCYKGLGRYHDAIECFNKARQLFGPNPTSRYFIETGNLFMSVGNFAEAKDMFRKGHEKLQAEDLGLSGNAATCLYKLAVVELREYHTSKREVSLDTAVTLLREAVTMMEYGKVADCELARASYMLSVALLTRDGGSTEALAWREKAELVRQALQGDSYLDEAHGEWAYDQMVEYWAR
ncbi:hypothetical protein B0I37DRAFT_314984 [Chaetomium sp. MPI-CAGE-AT-0009]|nr:hypothetical protein B0I37DRAFT_314984 [Chaetomium sp. MPI-CAGE-AT-0009]